jgi:hypothetical protein
VTIERTEIIAILRRVPDEVQSACEGLSDEELRRRPREGDWSLLELVCHLRDDADEDGLRVRRLVEEENPTLVPYDQEARAIERDYLGEDPGKAVTALRAFWSGLAYQLENLSDAEWASSGEHPEIGRVTVRSRAERQVEHSREHLAQMRGVRAAISLLA